MSEPVFFRRACLPSLAEIVEWTGARPADGVDLAVTISFVTPLDQGSPGALVFLDNPKYADALEQTRATACLISAKYAPRLPPSTAALIAADPYRAFATVVARLYPASNRPLAVFGSPGVGIGAHVHPEARLEENVTVDPGAVVGPRCQIGSGTHIAANAVIGADVCIGRDCSIGPNASILYALIGDRVLIHGGVRIGQDGFGFAMGASGHLKVPQIGRVIIQNDVEVGANTTIDRGANRDTVVGEGAKIDNLVQIGHNVVVGRHCIIVSQVGISGSTELGDFVALGGQAGVTGHLRIGMGAQIAAQAGVATDVPAGQKWGGSPARPIREVWRAQATLERLAVRAREQAKAGTE